MLYEHFKSRLAAFRFADMMRKQGWAVESIIPLRNGCYEVCYYRGIYF